MFSGEPTKLYCPYSGYPIQNIKWFGEDGDEILTSKYNINVYYDLNWV